MFPIQLMATECIIRILTCHHLFLEHGKTRLVWKSKKKKGKGTAARQKQPIRFNPNSRNHIVRFINKPLSNIDLLQWVTQLGIKYFRGIYSRDNLPNKVYKLETGIINLDDSMGESDEIQERDNVLCGYWCLYYLLERRKGRSLLDVIHNPKFSSTNQLINHQFPVNYFM